jgi:hypothetical protein
MSFFKRGMKHLDMPCCDHLYPLRQTFQITHLVLFGCMHMYPKTLRFDRFDILHMYISLGVLSPSTIVGFLFDK